MDSDPIYRIENLTHRYHDAEVLAIDSLTIPRSAIIGLTGPNGSGKTTLLKILACIEKPTAGLIRFDGRKAEPFAPHVRFQVTYLPQVPYLMKRSVIDNITYGLKIRNQPGDHLEKGYQAMSMVGLSGKIFSGRKWFELSGGEAQRVALAARLVLRPRVLLLDEPTANVDEDSSRLIRSAALQAREQWNTTLIIASHDMDWLHNMADDMIGLYQGRIFQGSRQNILFGPFQRGTGGLWMKPLDSEQAFLITAPPTADSVGIVASSNMRISPADDAEPTPENRVRGRLTHLRMIKHRNIIAASVQVEGFSFQADLSREQEADPYLYPGKEVYLSFDPADVQWLC